MLARGQFQDAFSATGPKDLLSLTMCRCGTFCCFEKILVACRPAGISWPRRPVHPACQAHLRGQEQLGGECCKAGDSNLECCELGHKGIYIRASLDSLVCTTDFSRINASTLHAACFIPQSNVTAVLAQTDDTTLLAFNAQ